MIKLLGYLCDKLPTPVAFAICVAGCWLLTWVLIQIARTLSPALFPRVNSKLFPRVDLKIPGTFFKVILSILGIAIPIAACYFLISSLSDMPTDDLLHLVLVSLAGAFVATLVACPTIFVWMLVLRRKN
jgi:hypothetical protein